MEEQNLVLHKVLKQTVQYRLIPRKVTEAVKVPQVRRKTEDRSRRYRRGNTPALWRVV